MRKVKAVYSRQKYKNGQVNDFAQNVHDSIDGNAFFITPSPSVSDLQSAIDDFTTTYQARVTSQGGKVIVNAVRTTRVALDRILAAMCEYVSSIAAQFPDSDPLGGTTTGTVVDSSGFPRQEIPAPLGILPAPADMRAKIAKNIPAGSFHAIWNKVEGANAYHVKVKGTGADAGYLDTFTTTRAKAIVSGLTPGGLYEENATAVNAAGMGVESNTLTIRAF
jgi:hypothetical protein